jgi:hypothetical protein
MGNITPQIFITDYNFKNILKLNEKNKYIIED